jgi:mannose-6-phosphate isomerase-like protein (cupin superfamily)
MEKTGYIENRPWGRYKILDQSADYKVKRIEVKPQKRLSLQSHKKRAEIWIIVRGKFEVTIAAKIFKAKSGDIIKINKGQKHRIKCLAQTKGIFIEIQLGSYFGEDDEIRWADDFKRI